MNGWCDGLFHNSRGRLIDGEQSSARGRVETLSRANLVAERDRFSLPLSTRFREPWFGRPILLSCRPTALLLYGLQFVAQGPVIAPLQPALLALAFARFDQVLQTTRPLHRRLPTFCASAVPLHTQLILPLPGDGQICELIFYAF